MVNPRPTRPWVGAWCMVVPCQSRGYSTDWGWTDFLQVFDFMKSSRGVCNFMKLHEITNTVITESPISTPSGPPVTGMGVTVTASDGVGVAVMLCTVCAGARYG